ncbi:winged helix-turn-helix domain-containing protein [Ornithinimicrobium cavernae]|uniref:winged helix-turn-helix domain-containing protein n=1 Tax=Ornithinimicrobium cavernae TaxID=2666047 RepID=UPI00137B2994|nr:winged helix-turn-helix domain-containing protein [Ornithinimicrobium cavernae]
MERVDHVAAPGSARQSLVLIVAATVEERIALTAGLGAAAPILVASDLTQARQVLARLPGASGRSPGHGPRREPSRGARVTGQPPGSPRASERGAARLPATLRLREDRLSLALADREVQLTSLEFALLAHLLPRVGEVVTFEKLSQVGWRTTYLGNGAHMHAAIGRLRIKLADLGAPVALEAVRGLGFRLVQRPTVNALREAVGN